jgi:hypothetical protein
VGDLARSMTFHVLGTVNRWPRYETVVSDVEVAWAVPIEPRVSVVATVAAAYTLARILRLVNGDRMP